MSKNDVKIFFAYEEWDKYCKNNNIPDPWELIKKHRSNWVTTTFDEIHIGEPTEEQKAKLEELTKYRDKYLEDRELWVGQFLFNKYGYDVLTTFAQAHQQSAALSQWYQQIKPCEGAQHECNLFCALFEECKGERA